MRIGNASADPNGRVQNARQRDTRDEGREIKGNEEVKREREESEEGTKTRRLKGRKPKGTSADLADPCESVRRKDMRETSAREVWEEERSGREVQAKNEGRAERQASGYEGGEERGVRGAQDRGDG